MVLVDSHAHLQWKDFEPDLSQVLQQAKEASVDKIICVSTELEDMEQVISLAQLPNIYAAIGVHPHEVKKLEDSDLDKIRQFATSPKVVAIGEIGLDYHYKHSSEEEQRKWLQKQVNLALEVKLPIIFHNRLSDEDAYNILKPAIQKGLTGVFHCYTSTKEFAKKILDLGFYISFAGILTFQKATALREVAKEVPLDRLLVETDCPYLTPEPHRGKRNEPAYVKLVAQTLAAVKGLSLEEIANQTTENAHKLFGLK